ncbi:MAG: periplasmic heavy metal sensor, partial [Planctomycetota bacterium]
MKLARYGGLTLVAIVCAAATYIVTYAVQQQTPPSDGPPGTPRGRGLTAALGLAPGQSANVQDIEARFAADRAPLVAQLADERDRLAALLENPDTPADQLMQQVDTVIAAHGALERRILTHLVELRPHLTAEQQQVLFRRFAAGVREGGGWRWRHGVPDGAGGPRGGGPGWRRGGPADRNDDLG